jgi:predicted Rossmann-fold nucleotide-binding protein
MPDIHPAPANLYTLADLTAGLDPSDSKSILQTLSFRQYQGYYPIKSAAKDLARVKKAAIHDAHISEAVYRYLQAIRKQPVGFMGGHGIPRNTASYQEIARLARLISQDGFLIVSGGGPGLMEAAHFGAFFANATDAEFESALSSLAAKTPLSIPMGTPGLKLLNDDGTINNPGDAVYTQALFDWYMTADAVRKGYNGVPGESLAVSTWEYGEEPVMPFATAYAAYFQNSIREASLIREARVGIVYGRGGGGTVREIFQDVEENYYVRQVEKFTPMIFFDPLGYWNPATPDSNTIKLDVATEIVFETAFAHPPLGQLPLAYKTKRVFTTDTTEIRNLLKKQAALSQAKFAALMM